MEAIVNQVFATFDVDGDQTLNKAEIRAFFDVLATQRADLQLSGDKFDAWFTAIDKDQDGSVVKAELQAYLELINYQG